MTSGSVETRAAKVALASGLSVFLEVTLQLVSVPVCLHYWGNETYGVWLALLALLNVVRTPDAGFSVYVGNELNLLYHRDQAALRKTLASGLAVSVWVGALQLAAVVLIAYAGPLSGLLGVPPDVVRGHRAGPALVVMTLGWVLTGTSIGIVHKLQVPAGLLHQATWWLMVHQVTKTASLIAAARARLDIAQAALLYSGIQALVYLATAVYVARKLPAYFPWWRKPSLRTGFRDLYRSTVLMGSSFVTQISTSGLVMVVSAGLGAAAVPAFTTVRTVANVWTMFGNVLISPLLPEVVRYHAVRDPKKLAAAFEAHWLIAGCAVNLSVLAGLPFFDDLYRYWTGGRVALDDSLLCYLLMAVVAQMPAALITVYLVGINDLRAAAISAVRGLVPLGVALALLPRLGLAGVGVAVVVGELAGPIGLGLPLFRQQLRRLGGAEVVFGWHPVALGTAAVCAALLARAAGSPHAGRVYAAAVAVALGSAVWSWLRVGVDVRERAMRLLRRFAPV